MKKLVPFKKDIPFDTVISEINSISLEHVVDKKSDNLIIGKFIVSGDYKMTPSTKVLDKFEYELPFNINVDKKYDIDTSNVDISDFYYEIINNKTLSVNIELTVDDVKEREIEEVRKEVEQEKERENIEKESTKETTKTEKIKTKEGELPEEERKENSASVTPKKETKEEKRKEHKEENTAKEEVRKETKAKDATAPVSTSVNTIKSIFGSLDENEAYVTYKVHVITENDTIESVCTLYNVTKDDLKDYNNLDDIKIGSKMIIPAHASNNENQ